jgi:spore coat polysaccharide biosynthesis protein SpsF
VLEFGANVGMNIEAMAMLLPPHVLFYAVEPNREAVDELRDAQICDEVYQETIATYRLDQRADLVVTRGVLIHTPPEDLDESYLRIYNSSKKYIVLAEYYSPRREMISYRGQDNLLWRGDFAGEMMERYQDLDLIDYGFVSKHDNNFQQDDVTWWLMEKKL